jgi:hypothetical protein
METRQLQLVTFEQAKRLKELGLTGIRMTIFMIFQVNLSLNFFTGKEYAQREAILKPPPSPLRLNG